MRHMILGHLQLHWLVILGSRHPLVRMVKEELRAAPSPPPAHLSHPAPAWLSLEHAACAGLAQSQPWWPYDHSAGLNDKIKHYICNNSKVKRQNIFLKHLSKTSLKVMQKVGIYFRWMVAAMVEVLKPKLWCILLYTDSINSIVKQYTSKTSTQLKIWKNNSLHFTQSCLLLTLNMNHVSSVYLIGVSSQILGDNYTANFVPSTFKILDLCYLTYSIYNKVCLLWQNIVQCSSTILGIVSGLRLHTWNYDKRFLF